MTVSSGVSGWDILLFVCRYYDNFIQKCRQRAEAHGWDPPLLGQSTHPCLLEAPFAVCCWKGFMLALIIPELRVGSIALESGKHQILTCVVPAIAFLGHGIVCIRCRRQNLQCGSGTGQSVIRCINTMMSSVWHHGINYRILYRL